MAARIGSKPRQAPKPSAPRQAPATIGDNSAYREEEERVQLISFIAKATQTASGVEAARVPFDAAKKAHNQVFALAKAANPSFTRKYLEKKMEQMNQAPAENARQAVMEARHDRWLGIITPEQMKLHTENNTPQESKDELDWQARGYSQGLRGLGSNLPDGIPPRMDQPFLKGHSTGYSEYVETLKANAPKQMDVRGQAAADFKEDNPEVDVDKAAKKLKGSKFMERGKEVELVDPGSGAPAVEVVKDPDDGFEATPEELAAQVTRPVRDDAGEVV